MPLASIGDSFSSFFDAVGDFVANLAAVNWVALLLGLIVFVGYLSVRARASFQILRAAYPEQRFRYREIWGAYLAGYGFNSVVPARGGDVVRLFLTKTSVPESSYPAVASSSAAEKAVFVLAAGAASLSWQLVLAGSGAALHHRLPPSARLYTALAGNAIVLALAVRMAAAA